MIRHNITLYYIMYNGHSLEAPLYIWTTLSVSQRRRVRQDISPFRFRGKGQMSKGNEGKYYTIYGHKSYSACVKENLCVSLIVSKR